MHFHSFSCSCGVHWQFTKQHKRPAPIFSRLLKKNWCWIVAADHSYEKLTPYFVYCSRLYCTLRELISNILHSRLWRSKYQFHDPVIQEQVGSRLRCYENSHERKSNRLSKAFRVFFEMETKSDLTLTHITIWGPIPIILVGVPGRRA